MAVKKMKGTDRRDEDRQKQVPTGGGGEERQKSQQKKERERYQTRTSVIWAKLSGNERQTSDYAGKSLTEQDNSSDENHIFHKDDVTLT